MPSGANSSHDEHDSAGSGCGHVQQPVFGGGNGGDGGGGGSAGGGGLGISHQLKSACTQLAMSRLSQLPVGAKASHAAHEASGTGHVQQPCVGGVGGGVGGAGGVGGGVGGSGDGVGHHPYPLASERQCVEEVASQVPAGAHETH